MSKKPVFLSVKIKLPLSLTEEAVRTVGDMELWLNDTLVKSRSISLEEFLDIQREIHEKILELAFDS